MDVMWYYLMDNVQDCSQSGVEGKVDMIVEGETV